MLSGGELKTLYARDFVLFEAERSTRYPEDHELRKLTAARYTPVFVFLDGSGAKVFEWRGFNNPLEGRAIHAFVSGKHYQKTTFREFLAAFSDR